MSRISFADLIRGAGVNIVEEYRELLTLLRGRACDVFPDYEFQGGLCKEYECRSFCNICDENFLSLPKEIRGTCRTLAKYNAYYEYHPENVSQPCLDDLLFLAEYMFTFSCALANLFENKNYYHVKTINRHVLEHLCDLKTKLHHAVVFDGAFVKLVPEDEVVVEAASQLPREISIKTFMYRHRSMSGNITEKKLVLKLLGDQLEPRRLDIRDTELRGAIFSILNCMDIRHNNTKVGDKYYHAFVADLGAEELEAWYDRLYDMMLAAFTSLNAQPALKEYSCHKSEIGE